MISSFLLYFNIILDFLYIFYAVECPYCLTLLNTVTGQWYRSAEGKKIAGICQGLAEHFQLPSIAFRLAFVIATVFGGWGLFIYICLWLLMPLKRSN